MDPGPLKYPSPMKGRGKLHLQVGGFRREKCRYYRMELLDCVIPYKYYAAEGICGVLDEIDGPDDLDAEVYHSALNMLYFSKQKKRYKIVFGNTDKSN